MIEISSYNEVCRPLGVTKPDKTKNDENNRGNKRGKHNPDTTGELDIDFIQITEDCRKCYYYRENGKKTHII